MRHLQTIARAERGIEPPLSTNEAAILLNRKPQTLRKWACYEDGPIRPVRINGRLAWLAKDIRALLGEGTAIAANDVASLMEVA